MLFFEAFESLGDGVFPGTFMLVLFAPERAEREDCN